MAFAIAISVLVLMLAHRHAFQRLRIPLTVYCGAYLATSAIGATWIGLQSDFTLWSILGGGLTNTSLIQHVDTPKYWFLVYAPFIIPPLVAMALELAPARPTTRKWASVLGPEIDFYPFAALLLACCAYCFGTMYLKGQLDLYSLLSSQGNSAALYVFRTKGLDSLGRTFWGLVDTGLPTLSLIALFKIARGQGKRWWAVFIFNALATVLLVFLGALKGPLILYLISLGIGLYILTGKRRLSVLVISAAAIFLLLTALFQFFLPGGFPLLVAGTQIVFRMASGIPYYINLYPNVYPHTGIDYGLDLIGLGQKANEGGIVFKQMYSNVTWVDGMAPAPAHIVAYAQAGVPFAAVVLAIIGVFIHMIARLGDYTDTPFGFALYVQAMIFLYYITQIALRETLISNFGIAWAVFVLAALMFVSRAVRLAVENIRAAIPK